MCCACSACSRKAPLYDPVALATVKAGAPQPKKPAPKPKVSPKPKKTTRNRKADGEPVDPPPDQQEEDGETDDLSGDEPDPPGA